MRSVVIVKANPGIWERGGGIKVWMQLCVERESYSRFGNSRNKNGRKKYYEAKKRC